MPRYESAAWRGCDKHGYGGNDVHLAQGLVIHSAEGSLAGLFSVLDSSRPASWHFSMAKDGRVFQHIVTTKIAWTNGSQDSNTRFWGIECEGGGPGNLGEPLAEPQYQALVGVVRWLWVTHGLGRYVRRQTLWEHNEMTQFGAASTSCPSGRIPWQRLIADLEGDMATLEERIADLKEQVGGLQAWTREHNEVLHGGVNIPGLQNWATDHGKVVHDENVSPRLKKLEEAQGSGGGIKRGDSVKLT